MVLCDSCLCLKLITVKMYELYLMGELFQSINSKETKVKIKLCENLRYFQTWLYCKAKEQITHNFCLFLKKIIKILFKE